MLKKEGRFVTFEQISTRLGKHRDDKDIISKIIVLLDAINDETCFNKLSRTWDQITNQKKNPSETLNEFFSRFETVQFSLNNADDSYVEPPKEASAEEKELMAGRKLELNDKLKAVVLLKCLDVEESVKRDILAKLDFQKEPSEVYAATKIAIRDICGAGESDKVNSSDQVLLTKPWQRQRSRSWSRNGRSRDRSWNRSQEKTQGGSRDWSRGSSRERSRGRDRRSRGDSRSVSFQERRDNTPAPGRTVENEVFILDNDYDEVYLNDEDFITNHCILVAIGQIIELIIVLEHVF